MSELLTAGARKNPDKIAFKSSSGEITYSELDRKTNQIANWLLANKVSKGERVGILIDKNIYTAYGLYGILKTGAVIVALDPAQPANKLKAIIKDCGIKVVLSIPSHQKTLDEISSPELLVLGSNEEISWEEVFSAYSSEALKVAISPQDNAYIIYTSGSTGEPKGIVHTHESGLAYARQSSKLYEVKENDVIGNVASLHFDQSTFGYFSAIYACCTTYVFSQSELIMLGSFCEAVRKNEITILYSVPSLFISLIRGGFDLDFPSVRWIKYGGESFPPALVNELLKKAPRAKISNVYGPAEVNQCTYFTIEKPVDEKAEIPIGTVWDNTEFLLLDTENNPVAKGVKGELLISSITMMTGYWNNESLNKKSFYLHNNNGEITKYYRTGDQAYLNEKGYLVFAGRIDRMVKINGYRVELGAVEHSLIRLPEIKDAAVFTTTKDGVKEICAAIVSNSESMDVKALKRKLMKVLPKQNVPKHILEMPSVPHSDNGKVHYRELEKQFRD
ncbi:amino acid adenylation domain-containing protein [Algoriphagus sediminis]|uniref:Amino acid adenylation domain-containing protein n=1 Tax=Algoriphagus sediminis TaxID=3057113 RepID=A0ABT7YCZ7_9BACT|nr:amino acid adenylation domain-containing protein [Algoriphagus sediminis]MDN3204395.1 amino acid adenylation domain-containing protein [Algoriphagus sediminis]